MSYIITGKCLNISAQVLHTLMWISADIYHVGGDQFLPQADIIWAGNVLSQ